MSREKDDKTVFEKYGPVALLALPVLLYFLIASASGGEDGQSKLLIDPVAVNVERINENELDEKLLSGTPIMRKTGEEITRETIAEHEAHLADAEITTEDRAALLMATGNLYFVKLLDYKKAINYYLAYIDAFPEGEKLSPAYLQLLSCYESLNDESNVRAVLRKMKEAFPEESQEYQFAVQKLEFGRIQKPAQRVPGPQ